MNKWLLGILCVLLSFPVQAKFLPKGGISKMGAELSTGALSKMDYLSHLGSTAQAASIARASSRWAFTPKIDNQLDILETEGFFRNIVPTPASELRLNIIHPSKEQLFNYKQDYRNFMKDFSVLRKDVHSTLFYQNILGENNPGMDLRTRRELIPQLAQMQLQSSSLLRMKFSTDVPLQQAHNWLNVALRHINPFHIPKEEHIWPRNDSRVFDRDEFFLGKTKLSLWAETYPLPETMRVAVLNDSAGILEAYRAWDINKKLGEGWKFFLYEDTQSLLNAIKSGAEYDLVITDIIVPGGGGYYLVDEIRSMGKDMTIIGCSMHRITEVNPEQMFKQGFDGYMYGDTMFQELSGWMSWKSLVSQHYHYKEIHGWSR